MICDALGRHGLHEVKQCQDMLVAEGSIGRELGTLTSPKIQILGQGCCVTQFVSGRLLVEDLELRNSC